MVVNGQKGGGMAVLGYIAVASSSPWDKTLALRAIYTCTSKHVHTVSYGYYVWYYVWYYGCYGYEKPINGSVMRLHACNL